MKKTQNQKGKLAKSCCCNDLPPTEHPAWQLRVKGLSIKAIAKKLHMGDKTVSAIVKRMPLPSPCMKKIGTCSSSKKLGKVSAKPKARKLSNEEIGKIKALRKSGLSIKAIGKEIHRAEKVVRDFCKTLPF